MRVIRRMVPAGARADRRRRRRARPAGAPPAWRRSPGTATPGHRPARAIGQSVTRCSIVGTRRHPVGPGHDDRRRRTARAPPSRPRSTARGPIARAPPRRAGGPASPIPVDRELDHARRRRSPRRPRCRSSPGRGRSRRPTDGLEALPRRSPRPASRRRRAPCPRGQPEVERRRPPCPTSVAGSVVGTGSPRTAVSGNSVVPVGHVARVVELGRERAASCPRRAARAPRRRPPARSAGTPRGVPPVVALGVVHADDVPVVARRDDA